MAIWKQPHFVYRVGQEAASTGLVRIEDEVPGSLVYAYVGRRRIRLGKICDDPSIDIDVSELDSFEILAPLHGAWLVEGSLMRRGLAYEAIPHGGSIGCWREDEGWRSALEERGREQVWDLFKRGVVRPHVADILTPYQAMNVAWAMRRPWVFNIWPCGSGKTLGAIVTSLTRRGPTLVLCPAKARHVWWCQYQEYTTLQPFRVRPRGERRADDETLEQYLSRTGDNAFVIVGAEAIMEYLDEVHSVRPAVLIIDELHTHGSRKRWQAIHREDGTVDFEKKKTKANNETRAACMMDVANMKSIQLRIGLTATPLDDGRPRRLWSQLDLLSPGGFSHSYRRFATRYCEGRPGQYGGLDDRGSSNLEELRARCSFFSHEVPYTESHASLPSTRVQVVYLDRTELNGAGRFSEEQTYNQAFKAMAKEAKFNHVAKERMIEARLAEACSRKRNFIVDEVKQGLQGGGKVVVFTARRSETEVWAQKIRKAVSQGDEQTGASVWMAHGGISETERDEITDAFRNHEGPCCLVATGQSVGTGVDGMQTADLAIFAMLPWKPGDFVQWKGRFDRLGGRATLLKVVVAVGTYDERVVEILTDKFGPIMDFLAADEIKGLDTKLLGLENQEALVESICDRLFGAPA